MPRLAFAMQAFLRIGAGTFFGPVAGEAPQSDAVFGRMCVTF